jgi:hypothetical protein
VTGGFNLFGNPFGSIFNYNGPLYFRPPFAIGAPGGLVRVPQPGSSSSGQGGLVVTGTSGGLGGLVAVPGSGSKGKGGGSESTSILATRASNYRTDVPLFLWALIPLALVVIALIGMVVFEPEPVASGSADGTAAPAAARPKPPPGALLLLGAGMKRAARAIGGVAGGLFGGSRPPSTA